MYYQGQLRQLGGGRKLGLGDIFHAFTRVIIPNMYQMYKNRNDKSYWRGKAMTQGPKILQKAVKLGVGVVSDAVSKKKTVKQSLKDRGKRLISEALNIPEPPAKRQKTGSARGVKKSRATRRVVSKPGARGRPTNNRQRDIFN